MLTELLAFCAGAATALTTTRSALRRFVREQASEQRWQTLVDAAGYGQPNIPASPASPASYVARRAAAGLSRDSRAAGLSAVAATAAGIERRPASSRRRIEIRVKP